ncbi:hypothetical protein ZIOFF_029213 [Zingiber officinale]|uniref:Uncharacterized protein n=1 Tax=Zingiber officinale TaxID=94328 RepID=A0A8J5GP98_ZINOF|nr:hypothetical protein ZIOFF_029213 [Zingiber officinale]
MSIKSSRLKDLNVKDIIGSIVQKFFSIKETTSNDTDSMILSRLLERRSTRSQVKDTANEKDDTGERKGSSAMALGRSRCGPAGLGLFLLGLDVVLTDIAPVMPALRRNLKRNRSALPRAPKHAQLYWNNSEQIRALRPPFDLVIAADVVYMEDSAAQLVSAMEALVADDGAILLGYQLRSPEAHQVFWELCHRTFPVIEKVPHEDLHPDYAYEETDVYIFRKRK